MPERLAAQALAELLGALSHPNRVRLIEELRDGEKDVNSLQQVLGISHSGVSQHLAVLRGQRVVVERRAGRHVFYHLRQPELARWLLDGTAYLSGLSAEAEAVRSAVETARATWSGEEG